MGDIKCLGVCVPDIVEQERFLLHQETLPKQLLEDKQQNPDTMPLLSAHNLISVRNTHALPLLSAHSLVCLPAISHPFTEM